MVLDTSVRQVDETPRPDEYLKMAANMKIVEIRQVCTAINISIRRYRKVLCVLALSFVSTFRLRCFNSNRLPHFFKNKVKFESDPFSCVSSRCVVAVSLMSCCWLDSNSMFMKVGVINQKDII